MSDIRGCYNSVPNAYILEIDSANEAKGTFSGKFGGSSRSSSYEKIQGDFHFYDREKRTDINFSTSDSGWHLEAPHRSGERYFEEWHAKKTSKSDPNSTQEFKFYIDLSGEGGSWFGEVTFNGEKIK
jgi:hypothetical protein